ncbi:hypothetical protein HELRODRAFT_184421 [Helobdella robusta]|uniref:Uncharacterized protein n=1 Tax=Helobdella robusta TaxID=6412 RepID=T1FL63_HELRO|nr:hypothetical protein HELRODRAFT_184421 [Helobdella robusta]ESN97633.1 hypothetical protein HELRODRAFT_184421 [Helobdella robusta]
MFNQWPNMNNLPLMLPQLFSMQQQQQQQRPTAAPNVPFNWMGLQIPQPFNNLFNAAGTPAMANSANLSSTINQQNQPNPNNFPPNNFNMLNNFAMGGVGSASTINRFMAPLPPASDPPRTQPPPPPDPASQNASQSSSAISTYDGNNGINKNMSGSSNQQFGATNSSQYKMNWQTYQGGEDQKVHCSDPVLGEGIYSYLHFMVIIYSSFNYIL